VQKIISINKGIYVLEIYSPKSFAIDLKAFHNIKFRRGYYYYVGSSQINLNKRIERHLKKDKTLHWHIDYITSLAFIKINDIKIFPSVSKEYECRLVDYLNDKYKTIFPAKKFGSSDCGNCYSHLLFSNKKLLINRKVLEIQPVFYSSIIFPIKKLK
jgi:Uri superfamily endonuclease